MRYLRFYAVVGRRHNVEVLVPVSGFGYGARMFQCRRCRELYAADDEFLERLSVANDEIPIELLGEEQCRRCETRLNESLIRYPETFVTPEGETGHLSVSSSLPASDESILQDVWFIHD